MANESRSKWLIRSLFLLSVMATGFAYIIASNGSFATSAIFDGLQFGFVWITVWVALLQGISHAQSNYRFFIPAKPRISPLLAALVPLVCAIFGIFLNIQFNPDANNMYMLVYLTFGLFFAGVLIGLRVAGFRVLRKSQ